ncbi:MAG: hypothetical protein ACE5EX_11260 [Phycisphaerae bacterium]
MRIQSVLILSAMGVFAWVGCADPAARWGGATPGDDRPPDAVVYVSGVT